MKNSTKYKNEDKRKFFLITSPRNPTSNSCSHRRLL